MSKPGNHKAKRAHCSVEYPGLLIISAPGHARHLIQYSQVNLGPQPQQGQLGVGSRTAKPARSKSPH